jgi:gliding-associated putative ABC transporter substrate-binding component GldG
MDVKKKYGVNALIALLALVGILVFVNLLSQRVYKRFDLSEGRIYTVPEYTRQLLYNLKDPLQVKVYFSTELPFPYGDYRRFIGEKMEEYQIFAGQNLRYEFIDPDLDPEVKKQMKQLGIPQIQLSDVSSNKLEVKNCFLGMALYYQDKSEVIPFVRKTNDLDYKITSLIRKLTSTRQPRVAIATDNVSMVQRDLSQVLQVLRQQYQVVFLDLGAAKELDDLADALVVLVPQKKLTPWQFFLIDRYVMAGKGVAFFTSPLRSNLQVMAAWKNQENNLNDLLHAYGVTINTDLLMDARNERISIQSRQGQFMVSNMVNYPLFPNLVDLNRGQVMVSDFQSLHFPFVSTVAPLDGATGLFTWLVRSSSKSKLQTKSFDIDPYKNYGVDSFNQGPYVVAATVTGKFSSYFAEHPLPQALVKDEEKQLGKEGEDKTKVQTDKVESENKNNIPPLQELQQSLVKATDKGRLIVVGCSDFMKNDYLDGLMASFFFNSVDWLLQDEGLISIRSRGMGNRPLKEIAPGMQQAMVYADIILVPLLLILAGLIYWRWRRRRIKKRVARLLEQ